MPEIYIIRPTQRAANQRGLPDSQTIIDEGVAEGFVGNLARVSACQTIIIIDDEGSNKAAEILNVTLVEPLDGQARRRVRVNFGPTRNLNAAEQQMCDEITWSSSNIRYRTLL